MRDSRLSEHVCPACRSDRLMLEPDNRSEHEVLDGKIICQACGETYRVVRGIPRFVAADNYAESFGFQWNKHAKTQLDSYSGLSISADRVRSAIGRSLELKCERILEAGSGAGRFTEILATSGADVISFDFSSAVDANASNQQPSERLHLFQGDIFHIPLQERSFDRVLCLGVIQHTPDPHAAFQSLARYVRPGGQIVVDVYTRNLAALLQWKYVLRPITRRMPKETLYRAVELVTPPLIPVARSLRKVAGRLGARLVPIVEYSHLGLRPDLGEQWAILDTFDMYSPAHDHPQSQATLRSWFEEAGFENISVRPGPNGVVGSGMRPRSHPVVAP